MIDNKTSRLQLPLPNVENYLEEDVERLSEALTTLDGVVATIAEDGKLVQDQVPEYVARLDTEGKLPSDNLPVSAVQTDGEGKIPEGVIPDEIARDSEVLAKGANLSDLADRAAAWLNVRPVGSTPLAGDPVGDYDAATKRWVQNMIGSGTIGPTMNGVMNYGVGDFHLRDSRAYIQPYEVVSDGQLLNRADWPELWAYAQMLGPISDADWLADPRKRGKYSSGNGTTTFRVPDRNGVQAGSIKSLYARGDGGNPAGNGVISQAAAPDITGRIRTVTSYSLFEGGTGLLGSFYGEEFQQYANQTVAAGSGSHYPRSANFSANKSDSVYGRYGIAGTLQTDNFAGVWVIRASGGFVAANTSWSVINGDATRPSNGTTVDGGNVYSLYKVNGVNEAEARFRARADIGGNYYARISVSNTTTGRSAALDFDETGSLVLPSDGAIKSGNIKIDFATSSNDLYIGCSRLRVSPLAGGQTMGLSSLSGTAAAVDSAWFENWGNSYGISGDKTRHTVVECKAGNAYLFYAQKLNSGTIQFRVPGEIIAATITQSSDRDLKDNITLISNATESLRKMNGYTYTLKENGMPYAGVIAQEVMEALPEAVGTQYRYKESSSEENPERYYTVDYSAVTGLLVQVARESDERISALEKEVAELKELVNLMLQK